MTNNKIYPRFLSPDPLFEQFDSWMPYHFAFNNPVMYSDPSGLAPKKEKREAKLLDAPGIYSESDLGHFGMLNEMFALQREESRRRQDQLEEQYYGDWEEFDRWQAVTRNKMKGSSGDKYDNTYDLALAAENKKKLEAKEKENKEKGNVEEDGLDYGYTTEEAQVYGKRIDDFSSYMKNLTTIFEMTFDWVMGDPSPELSFHDNNSIADAMRNAWKVDEARDLFYSKYEGEMDLTNATVTEYGARFGLEGLFRAGVDPVEQFIGSYDINIYARQDMLHFHITNRTSFTSLFYGIGPDWKGGMMGNWNQRYIFTEPINFKRLK